MCAHNVPEPVWNQFLFASKRAPTVLNRGVVGAPLAGESPG